MLHGKISLIYRSLSIDAVQSFKNLPCPQLDHRYNEFKLRAIMSEHKKTITAISWSPHNPEVFASASADNLLIIWNVAEQKAVARLDNTKGILSEKNKINTPRPANHNTFVHSCSV